MSESPFWNEDWMKLQQQYWQQWTDLGQKSTAFSQPQKAPWESAMEHWMKAVMPRQDNQSFDLMQKMIEQGNIFLKMGESLSGQMEQGTDWSKALDNVFSQLNQNFDNVSDFSQENIGKLMGFWHSPVDNWGNFVSSVGFSDAEKFTAFNNPVEKFLASPGIGYTRELEELNKEFMQAVLDYQKALFHYNIIFKDLGVDAVQRIKDKVAKLQQQEKSIDNAKAFYDLWVSVCEESYAELVMTDDYSRIHGDLVNALMKCKNLWAQIMEMILAELNIPTQKQVRTLQTRFQESRREIRSLKSSLSALQKEVEAMKAQQLETAAKAPAKAEQQSVTKAVVKKKTVRKKAVTKKAAVKKSAKSR